MDEMQGVYLKGYQYDAVRYSDAHGNWESEAVARIANFVIGADVETRATGLNEQLMDVVRPVDLFWKPDQGIADLEVIDPKTGVTLSIGVGSWLIRHRSGKLHVASNNGALAMAGPKKPEASFEERLREVLATRKKSPEVTASDAVVARYLVRILAAYETACVESDTALS